MLRKTQTLVFEDLLLMHNKGNQIKTVLTSSTNALSFISGGIISDYHCSNIGSSSITKSENGKAIQAANHVCNIGSTNQESKAISAALSQQLINIGKLIVT